MSGREEDELRPESASAEPSLYIGISSGQSCEGGSASRGRARVLLKREHSREPSHHSYFHLPAFLLRRSLASHHPLRSYRLLGILVFLLKTPLWNLLSFTSVQRFRSKAGGSGEGHCCAAGDCRPSVDWQWTGWNGGNKCESVTWVAVRRCHQHF